jgi:hypothetical protein
MDVKRAVEPLGIFGVGLKTHDVNSSEVWTSCKQALGHKSVRDLR